MRTDYSVTTMPVPPITTAFVDRLPLLLVPIPMVFVFAGAYLLLAPLAATAKQKAYILSTISSGLMSLASLRYLTIWCTHGWQGLIEKPLPAPSACDLVAAFLGRLSLSQAMSAFFASYLLGEKWGFTLVCCVPD